MKKQNTSGFSIIIAILLVVIMTLLVFYILEYMIPYSKNVKGIENSSNAFYQTESGIENALFHIKTRGNNITTESGQTMPGSSVGSEFGTTSSGIVIPYDGEGNSEFDSTYNQISIGNPIQLEVGGIAGLSWSNIGTNLLFKVPDLDDGGAIDETLSGSSTAIINWQLSSTNDTLNATGSWITEASICKGNSPCSTISMATKKGQKLDGTEEDFQIFYTSECGTGKSCILKLSIINKLELVTPAGTQVPYLEYKIHFNRSVPLRFSRIKAKGKSYGFQKSLEVRVPQQTTNEAFDFTVFQ